MLNSFRAIFISCRLVSLCILSKCANEIEAAPFIGDEMKQCSCCKQFKPLDQFYKNKRYKGGYTSACKDCYYQARVKRESDPAVKEHKARVNQEWYKANRPDIRQRQNEYNRSRWKDNPEVRQRKNLLDKIRFALHPEKKEKKNKQKSDRDKERRVNDPKYRERVLNYIRVSNHKRRAAKAKVRSNIKAIEWKALCEKWNYKCLCCGITCQTDVPRHARNKSTLDHIKPLSRGGTDTIDNAQLLCRYCNSKKSTKTIDYRPK